MRVCERTGDGEDINVQKSMEMVCVQTELESSVIWEICWVVLEERIQHQWQDCIVRGESLELSWILTRKTVSSNLKKEDVCEMPVECNGVWK